MIGLYSGPLAGEAKGKKTVLSRDLVVARM